MWEMGGDKGLPATDSYCASVVSDAEDHSACNNTSLDRVSWKVQHTSTRCFQVVQYRQEQQWGPTFLHYSFVQESYEPFTP
jgi:hypothetical protein